MNKTICLLSLLALAFSKPQQSYTDRSRHGREFIGGSSSFTNPLSSGFLHGGHHGNQFNRQFQSRQYQATPAIPILRESRQESPDGSYTFEYESADGTSRYERGTPGAYGAVVKEGGWTVNYPDGTSVTYTYIADENGFRVQSSALPKGPPIPPHAQAQIEKAARERAQGIVHDGQYHPERYGQNKGLDHQSRSFILNPQRQNFRPLVQRNNQVLNLQGQKFRPLVHRNNQVLKQHGFGNRKHFGTDNSLNHDILHRDNRNQAIFRQKDHHFDDSFDFNHQNRFNSIDQYK